MMTTMLATATGCGESLSGDSNNLTSSVGRLRDELAQALATLTGLAGDGSGDACSIERPNRPPAVLTEAQPLGRQARVVAANSTCEPDS